MTKARDKQIGMEVGVNGLGIARGIKQIDTKVGVNALGMT